MTHNEETEPTAGGALGKLAGKAKEVAGEMFGDRDLAREGRLQDSAADAELDARRKDAEAQVKAENAREEAEKRAEEDRFQRETDAAKLEAAAARAESRADQIDPEETR